MGRCLGHFTRGSGLCGLLSAFLALLGKSMVGTD